MRPPPCPPHTHPFSLYLSFYYTPKGDKKRKGRKDIFENVDKRPSVSPTRLPKGVVRELNSVY